VSSRRLPASDAGEHEKTVQGTRTDLPLWSLIVAIVAVVGSALVALGFVGGSSLPERTGPPAEELAVERTVLSPGTIELTVRNTGADPVQVAQVFVNDAYVGFSGGADPVDRLGSTTLRLDYPWHEGQPYLVSMLTSTGAVVEHEVPAAVATPALGRSFFASMVLLGTYVGVVPVLLGMLFLPVLRRLGGRGVRALLALTVGVLGFLAVDATLEGSELAQGAGAAFGGVLLVPLGAAFAFLGLMAVDRWLRARAVDGDGAASGGRLSLLIAIGIGLHNLGEGLAIGSAYAVGALALGSALVVGFGLHNTTEGVAIVAPLTREDPSLVRLLTLGAVAGAPAIVGALIGATVENPAISALLLGLGVGAIAQVAVQIAPSLRSTESRSLDPAVLASMAAGALLMYGTGLLVAT
jgi:zinc transporter ZupT